MSSGITEWLTLVISSLFLLGFLIYIGIRVYRHIEQLNAERRRETLLVDLQDLIFAPWSDELPVNDICAVCIESYSSRDSVCIFPCRHGAHTNCAERWISRCLLRCPQCHGEIVPNSRDYTLQDFRTPEPQRRGRRGNQEETPLLRPTIFQQLNRRTDFTVAERPDPPSNEHSNDSSVVI